MYETPTNFKTKRRKIVAVKKSPTAELQSAFPRAILVCPVCQGELSFSASLVHCSVCCCEFPQEEGCGGYNLLPNSFASEGRTLWRSRLLEMERWYGDLVSFPRQTENCFKQDYEPYSSILATFRGRVLDVGGGAGVARHYLQPVTEYIVADPSLTWRGSQWSRVVGQFPCLANAPNFVRAVGEFLPFPDGSFDAALSFWSLNHVDQPERVLQEVGRVLKPEGRFLMVSSRICHQLCWTGLGASFFHLPTGTMREYWSAIS